MYLTILYIINEFFFRLYCSSIFLSFFFKKFLTGLGSMSGRIIVLSQVYGKEQVGEKSFPSVAVMTIKLLLIHLYGFLKHYTDCPNLQVYIVVSS